MRGFSLDSYTRRHSVSRTKVFGASNEEIWELISMPGNLNSCHPFCRSNEAITWEEGSHSDELVYLNGLRYIRNFHVWSPGIGYDLMIGEEGGPQSLVKWRLKSLGMDRCSLNITVFPYLIASWPKPLSYLPFRVLIKPKLSRYLDSVLSGFNHFVESGEDVPRNHFGAHPWFS